MARNKSRPERLDLMRRAWRLAVEGKPQTLIASELGISQPQVSRYLARISSRASDRLIDDARTYAILSLNQTDAVLFEALKAFERSTRPKKSATKKTPTSADGSAKGAPTDGSGSTTTQVVEREGDPAWLSEVRAAIRLRFEVLDRVAPAKKAEDDEDGGDGTLAGALLDAERRDESYTESHDTHE